MSLTFIVKIGGSDHTFRVYPPTYDGRPANVLVNVPNTSGGMLIYEARKFKEALEQAIQAACEIQDEYDKKLAAKKHKSENSGNS